MAVYICSPVWMCTSLIKLLMIKQPKFQLLITEKVIQFSKIPLSWFFGIFHKFGIFGIDLFIIFHDLQDFGYIYIYIYIYIYTHTGIYIYIYIFQVRCFKEATTQFYATISNVIDWSNWIDFLSVGLKWMVIDAFCAWYDKTRRVQLVGIKKKPVINIH